MNFTEQKDRIKESCYKYVSLWKDNVQIATWNLAGKIDAKLDEIENAAKK